MKHYYKIGFNLTIVTCLCISMFACRQNEVTEIQPVHQAKLLTIQEQQSDFDQAALLISSISSESGVTDEVFKSVKLKYEGYSQIMFKYLFDNLSDKQGRLSTNEKIFSNALTAKYKSGNYPKSKIISPNKGGRSVNNDLLQYLKEQNVEIYWPYWQKWDGKELPTITYTPADNDSVNIGYKLKVNPNGNGYLTETVRVNDDYAFAHPTWILQNNKPLPTTDPRSGIFIPNYGDDSYTGLNPYTKSARIAESLVPADNRNGLADINKIFVGKARTNGKNFNNIFNGGSNDLILYCGDERTAGSSAPQTTTFSIDRWAGRKGVWRRVNSVWDENWKGAEVTQWMGIECINCQQEHETTFTANAKLVKKATGSISSEDEKKLKAGLSVEGGFEAGISWSIKTTHINKLMSRRERDRRQFFAENYMNADGKGMEEGVAVRDGGQADRGGQSQLYFTIEVQAYNYVP